MNKYIIFYEAYDNNGDMLFKSSVGSNIDTDNYGGADDIKCSFESLAFSAAAGIDASVNNVELTGCTKL